MTPFETVLLVSGAVMSVAALFVVYRMIVGPTILDRAISADMIVVLIVIAMALYSAHAQANWAGPAMLALTGLAFIGTVTFARFVAREGLSDELEKHLEEPEATTGPLQAIHLDHGGRTPDPANVVVAGEAAAAERNVWDQDEVHADQDEEGSR